MMANSRLVVGVLFGGRSGEHEVSLNSARSVLAVLDPARYDVLPIGITHTGEWVVGENVLEDLSAGNISGLRRVTLLPAAGDCQLYAIDGGKLTSIAHLDVIFPVLHGTFGEDGTMQGLLELADVAYVGAGVLGSAVGMDKALFKDVMNTRGIPVLESAVFSRSQLQQDLPAVMARCEQVAPYPLFVKPANLGSSVGITKCRSHSDLLEGLMEAARYDRRILVERGISAREIEVSVLGNDQPRASIPGEIRPSDDFYTYRAKYIDNQSELIIPARLSEAQAAEVMDLAVRTYSAIDCAGMARVDFLVDKETGKVFVNEINTIPGFTQISMYPKLWQASGLPYPALVDELIRLALERKSERDHTERQFDPPEKFERPDGKQ
ncbi:MAG TPA: D-alanine--D-alanine ligase family protein [Anaerolineaceae bacterium]|nr:D-alanine--D-alanine ligase family protein [Anaerolineaceae bacterium]